jgi:hypothetical protein
MPDRREAEPQARSTDPFMGTIVLVLVALLAAVIALALGLTWKGLLHWTGELLLIIGIALAAVGISDVRREWTQLPGIRGRVKEYRYRTVTGFWAVWNSVVTWKLFAKLLRLRPHPKVVEGTAEVRAYAGVAAVSGLAGGAKVVVGGTVEDRVAWLENRMADVWGQFDIQRAWHEQEVRDRQAATEEERAARTAEEQRIRDSIANLAGGGLKLQAWGVACLLTGTVITAIW